VTTKEELETLTNPEEVKRQKVTFKKDRLVLTAQKKEKFKNQETGDVTNTEEHSNSKLI